MIAYWCVYSLFTHLTVKLCINLWTNSFLVYQHFLSNLKENATPIFNCQRTKIFKIVVQACKALLLCLNPIINVIRLKLVLVSHFYVLLSSFHFYLSHCESDNKFGIMAKSYLMIDQLHSIHFFYKLFSQMFQ